LSIIEKSIIVSADSESMAMSTAATNQKKKMPPPGRKLGFREALARTNRKFAKTLAKLAK
jgi:hypothetical protein